VDEVSNREVDIDDVIPYFESIVFVTSLASGRNPNRMRALAGQIARNAIKELRRPTLVQTEPEAASA
jgi:hypothetical protein